MAIRSGDGLVARLVAEVDGWWCGQLLSRLPGGEAIRSGDWLVVRLIGQADGW